MSSGAAARAAQRLDPHLTYPVVVVGSLPPHGSDLDLLVPDERRREVESALRVAGFAERGPDWRVPAGDEAVELISPRIWGLDAGVVERLIVEAEPLPGLRRLHRPAPYAGLLLLALQLPLNGRLTTKRRERADRVLAADPRAWRAAEDAAHGWSAGASLALLRAALDGAPDRSLRLQAGYERIRAARPTARWPRFRTAHAVLRASLASTGRPPRR